ncbi:hypothetical protein KXW36_009739, partial [Aspergillus fumigatus]
SDRRAAAVRGRRLLHAGPQGALRAGRPARAPECDQPRLPAGAQHRPRPRPLAHHDAHGEVAAAQSACVRTLRRIPSRGRTARGPRERRAGAPAVGPWRDGGPCGDNSRAAAWLRVRADALERRVCRRGAHQRAGQSRGRPDLRPAGAEAHAGAGRALFAEMARLHPEPPRDRAACRRLLGARPAGALLPHGAGVRRSSGELGR